MNWNRYNCGVGWTRLPDGTIVSEKEDELGALRSIALPGGGYVLRTNGDPITAWTALRDFGGALEKASKRFDVPICVLFAMMGIEATKQQLDRSHFNPRCYREEPGYISDGKTPNKVSPGLLQTLISTARGENRRRKLYLNFDGTLEELTREDLFVPERSIMLGASYMRHQIDRKEDDEVGFDDDDPILLCSAYNAGSVRPTTRNAYHLLTYGGISRIEKFIAYNNDMISITQG
jgi:Transglycosylase SLT domain